MKRADPRQKALDELGRRLGWEPGPFRSWKARGYTMSVGRTGYPRRHLLAVRAGVVNEFRTVEELAEFIRVGGWPVPVDRA